MEDAISELIVKPDHKARSSREGRTKILIQCLTLSATVSYLSLNKSWKNEKINGWKFLKREHWIYSRLVGLESTGHNQETAWILIWLEYWEHVEDHNVHPGDWWEINISKLDLLWLDDLNPGFTTWLCTFIHGKPLRIPEKEVMWSKRILRKLMWW